VTNKDLARYLNGIPLEKALAWFWEKLGFGSILKHNNFDPSIYPHENSLIVDEVLEDKALIEATNPKPSTFLNDNVIAEKIDYFIRKDPKHLLLWVLVCSFANFSDYIRQLIDKLGIILIELGETATTANFHTFKRHLFRSKLYALAKQLTQKTPRHNTLQYSNTTLDQYRVDAEVNNPSMSYTNNLYQHRDSTEDDYKQYREWLRQPVKPREKLAYLHYKFRIEHGDN
jgi:hypothetical protein